MLAVLAWWPLFPAVLLGVFMLALLIFDPAWAAGLKDHALAQKLTKKQNHD